MTENVPEKPEMKPEIPEKRLLAMKLVMVFLVAVAVFGLQVADMVAGPEKGPVDIYERDENVMTGDLYIKLSLLKDTTEWGSLTDTAVAFYEKALPLPAAKRRLLALHYFFDRTGYISNGAPRLDDPAEKKHLTKEQFGKLKNEQVFWEKLYTTKLSAEDAREVVLQLEKLELGPFEYLTIARVYWNAGVNEKANEVYESGESKTVREFLLGAVAFLVFFGSAGLGAIALLVVFIRGDLRNIAAGRTGGVENGLIFSFLAYIVSYLFLGLVFLQTISLVFEDESKVAALVGIAAVITSFAVGLFVNLASTGYDVKKVADEVGLRFIGFWKTIVNGLGAYVFGMPFVIIGLFLGITVLRNILPDASDVSNPIVPVFLEGDYSTRIATVILVVVIVPVVEEWFFRGVLFASLRKQAGFWGAACASSAVFAMVHPVSHVLAIFGLGMAFSAVRERTKSVIPGIIGHSIFNTVSLVMARYLMG